MDLDGLILDTETLCMEVARAVLAADYKALLAEYLTHLGGVLVPGACRGLAPDMEVRGRGGLLGGRRGGWGGGFARA